jgi:hypothetical protein
MSIEYQTQSGNSAHGNRATALEAIEALYRTELESNMLVLRQQQRRARLDRSLAQWAEYWPVVIGIFLSLLAPQLRAFAEAYRPWGLWLSFPMVALSTRPEMYMGSKMAAHLPMAMAYLQFPLEGLLAKLALRGNVTVHGVLVQVAFFHGLCILDLWMISGGLQQLWHLFAH